MLEVVIIAVVLSGIKLVRDAPYTGPRGVDVVGAVLSVIGMGGVVLGILVWQEGGEAVGALIGIGVAALGGLAWWLIRSRRLDRPALLDSDMFRSKPFRLGVIVLIGFTMLTIGVAVLIPIVPRADLGWGLIVPLLIAGSGLGMLVSQLNDYPLSPMSEERVSEAAGTNSAAGSFGLSFGLALAGAVLLASLAVGFTSAAESSTVLPPAGTTTGGAGARRRRGGDE